MRNRTMTQPHPFSRAKKLPALPRMRTILRALLVGAVTLTLMAVFAGSAHADPFTANPYTGQFASPNCTWYAWQRLHDTEHVDLQFSADAQYWIQFAAGANAAWDETSGTYVQAEINDF